ncbi:DUF808 domain-containing protein [Brevundimonas sp. SORGH_AS_0993]|uniref:DUF808 domain-containing protein n=1 Tax=Brevundimonas sp. SORGH_AS_0993 TaxID=3041794 RepID=UPI00278611FB|nr:DUF808 domain-containing protein [Brevundimonas sp. SORGH_AS_0993]MDQ1152830.1 putative DNA repair protein MutK [Brevundimonas sp. SORGH_AS_0993]
MPSGLIALLDDVAGIAKMAAASIDDVGAAAGRASTKAAGVVVDDAAVTPRYVTGLSPSRELPIIGKIALGSFRNKLLLILPVALLLSAFAPWGITPILMCGGAYLCFEGAEKLMEAVGHGGHEDATPTETDPRLIEKTTVSGAVRTDLILSAEIMAIALADVATQPILTQAVVLAVVGVAMTVAVYGVVGLIVKMDDIGLGLAKRSNGGVRALGRGLVKGMPVVMDALGAIGTAAMLWVGGGILVHGAHTLGLAWPAEPLEHLAHGVGQVFGPLDGVVAWLVMALGAALVGVIVGGVVVLILHQIGRMRGAPAH